MINSQRGFAPILIILLGLVVIGSAAYFYAQNNPKEILKSEVLEKNSLPTAKKETETLAKNSTSSTNVSLPTKDEVNQLQKKSAPLTTYFEKSSSLENVSNIVGYFAYGAFYTYLPIWIADNWQIDGSDNGEVTTISPRNDINNRDFSNIRMVAKNSSESFNANWLFENEKKDFVKNIINFEIITTDNDNMLVYHIEKDIGEQIMDLYYIDGNGKTAVISFSSSKSNYYYYSAKIKKFIQSLTLSKEPRG
jgi:hypothetical protein